MKLQKCLLVAATASLTLLVAGCFENDNDTPPAPPAPLTLKQFAVNDLNNNTSDTAAPIEINDLVIDDSNEDPAQYDDLLQST